MKKVFTLFFAMSLILASVQQSWAILAEELGTIVVTASRLDEENYKLAGNVSVLTREQIEATNARTIPDVLSYALGVNVYDNSTAKSAIVDIRGFGETSLSNVLILVDGRRVNAVDLSGPDLIQIPVDAVERIEIIRGAGSVLYGDNAVGGVVNIITKKGEGDLHGYVGGKYGSYDANSTDMQVSGSKNGFSYYLYNQYLDDRGYRDHSDLLAKDHNGRFGYNWQEKIKTNIDVGWHKDVQELPGGLTDSELASMGRRATAFPLDTSFTTDRYVKVGLDFSPWLHEQYWGDLVVDLHYRNRDVYDEFNRYGPFHTKRDIERTGGTAKYIFDHTLFGKEVNFVTGVDLYNTDNDIKGSADNTDDITITKEELGIFGFLQYELYENLFVNGGTRYHQAEYTFDQRNNGPSYITSRPDDWVSMGGLKYEYAKGSNVHFNAQQTFRFLASDEWYSSFTTPPSLNLDLDQQRGIQYEAGIKHNFDDKVIVSATPHLILLKHEIFYDPTPPNARNSNYDETRRIGVEIGGKVDVLEFLDVDFLNKLEAFTNFTYQNAEQTKGANKGKDIPFVPSEEISAGIITGFLNNYTFSLLGRHIGSRYAISDQANVTPPVKPYYSLDAKLAYERNNFEIFAGINNLTNEKYFNYVVKAGGSSARTWYAAPERNFDFGMKVKF